jgi:tetratricopeptide (TPR) repeat protein
MRTLLFSLLLLVAAAGGVRSSAQAAPGTVTPPTPEALERARALSDQGRAFHDRGEYGRAVDAYQEAYVLAPSPGILFNLGQAYRLKGDCTNAGLMYRAFLRSRPAPEHQQVAEGHLATVDRCAGPTSVVTTSGEPERPGRGLRQGGVITAIAGGALLGTAGYFAYRAADASDEVEDRYNRGEPWRNLESRDADGRRDNRLAIGLAITGGAAVVTGGVLYFLGWRQAEQAGARPALTLAPAPRGGTVRLAWGF